MKAVPFLFWILFSPAPVDHRSVSGCDLSLSLTTNSPLALRSVYLLVSVVVSFFLPGGTVIFFGRGHQVEVLEYPELGMEAVWKIDVENFPAFIVVDGKGDLADLGRRFVVHPPVEPRTYLTAPPSMVRSSERVEGYVLFGLPSPALVSGRASCRSSSRVNFGLFRVLHERQVP